MSSCVASSSAWAKRRAEKHRRLERARHFADGVVLSTDHIVAALQALIAPGDRVVLEGTTRSKPISCRARWHRPTPTCCTICT